MTTLLLLATSLGVLAIYVFTIRAIFHPRPKLDRARLHARRHLDRRS
ncbi:hypothetical protein [Cupriavidus sp. IDO]|nr:hypothetical protein [Cupriavidus sp. IDO]